MMVGLNIKGGEKNAKKFLMQRQNLIKCFSTTQREQTLKEEYFEK